jgi:membrane protein
LGIALASFFPLEHFLDRIVRTLGGVVPADVIAIIQEQITKISQGDSGGILTFGLVLALWSSSAAMMGMVDALNRAYDIEDSRAWWRVRLLALVLTLALAAFVLIAFALVLLGPTAADHVARMTGLGPVFAWTWKILQWPVILALVGARRGHRLLLCAGRGAGVGVGHTGLGANHRPVAPRVAGLQVLRHQLRGLHETYGAIGGVKVLLWFYISGLVMLLGAELNAEIEHASPYGKAAGEKVPGQRRAIGALTFGRYQKLPAPARLLSAPTLPAPAPGPLAGTLRRVAVAAAIIVFRAHER